MKKKHIFEQDKDYLYIKRRLKTLPQYIEERIHEVFVNYTVDINDIIRSIASGSVRDFINFETDLVYGEVPQLRQNLYSYVVDYISDNPHLIQMIKDKINNTKHNGEM